MNEISTDMLQERAQKIMSHLPKRSTSPNARPIFVEFSGTPKSGKSTCIDSVGHFLRRMGFHVLAPTEGASKRTPYYLKNDPVAFNTWSACYALSHLFDGHYHSDRYDIAILDRGLFDALVWFELLKEQQSILSKDFGISSQECKQVQDFLRIGKWRSLIDAVFLFTTDPKTAMIRENQYKITNEPGRAMNESFLDRLNKAYQLAHENLRNDFTNFVTIDTSGDLQTNPLDTACETANHILKLFEEKLARSGGTS